MQRGRTRLSKNWNGKYAVKRRSNLSLRSSDQPSAARGWSGVITPEISSAAAKRLDAPSVVPNLAESYLTSGEIIAYG